MQPQTFIFFGQVGSGKGTQVKLLTDLLKKKYGLETVYAGTGEGFRKLIESNNYTAGLIKEYMDDGVLLPDFLANSMITDLLISNLSPEKNLITDGYPRTLEQAKSFEKKMKFWRREQVKIIYIEVGKEEAMKRNLLRGRADDTTEAIEQRFDVYVNQVMPTMNYFKDKENYTIHEVNGEQSVEKVHQDIINALGY